MDVVLHAGGPVMHAVSLRLGPGFIAGPTIMSDPVNSNDGSGSVDSFLAMNKDRLVFRRVDDRQYSLNVSVARTSRALKGYIEITQAEVASLSLFSPRALVRTGKIHHRLNAEFGELLKVWGFGLSTPVEFVVNLMKVWKRFMSRSVLWLDTRGKKNERRSGGDKTIETSAAHTRRDRRFRIRRGNSLAAAFENHSRGNGPFLKRTPSE